MFRMKKTSLAIFASGSGSNAEAICAAFAHSNEIEVSLLVSNREGAEVLDRLERFGVEQLLISNHRLEQRPQVLLEAMSARAVDFIVLAGFLRLLPALLVRAYRGRILNIHPSLLPKYGGRGMYGRRVHEAVLRNREQKSGISIHQVNEAYDQGGVVFQASIPVTMSEPDELARAINGLELRYYPEVIAREVRRLRASGYSLITN